MANWSSSVACSRAASLPGARRVTPTVRPARQVLYVAHAGDSRAVLASDGEALRLTADHKPDRPDECVRVWVRPSPQRFVLVEVLRRAGHMGVFCCVTATRQLGEGLARHDARKFLCKR